MSKLINIWRNSNEYLAVKITDIFGSMEAAWFCLFFTLVPLRWPSTMPFVQYASSGVAQLVLLPLIAVGVAIKSRSSDRQREEDHAALMELVNALHDKHDASHGTDK